MLLFRLKQFRVSVYKNGYANESLETTYTVELSCGEGVFVTLDF